MGAWGEEWGATYGWDPSFYDQIFLWGWDPSRSSTWNYRATIATRFLFGVGSVQLIESMSCSH